MSAAIAALDGDAAEVRGAVPPERRGEELKRALDLYGAMVDLVATDVPAARRLRDRQRAARVVNWTDPSSSLVATTVRADHGCRMDR